MDAAGRVGNKLIAMAHEVNYGMAEQETNDAPAKQYINVGIRFERRAGNTETIARST